MASNRTRAIAAPALAGLTPDLRAVVLEEEALLAACSAPSRGRSRSEGDLVGAAGGAARGGARGDRGPAHRLPGDGARPRGHGARAPGRAARPAAPYFAHLRVREGEERRDYCLGRTTFVDRARASASSTGGSRPSRGSSTGTARARSTRSRSPGACRGRRRGAAAWSWSSAACSPASGRRAARSRAAPTGAWRDARRHRGRARRRRRAPRRGRARSGTGAGARGRAARPDVTALLDPEQFEAVSAPRRPAAPRARQRGQRQDDGRPPPARADRLRRSAPLPGLAAAGRRPRARAWRGSPRACSSRSASSARRSGRSTPGRAAPSRARSACRRRGSARDTPPLVARLKRHPALYEALRRRPARRRRRGPRSSRLRARARRAVHGSGVPRGRRRAPRGATSPRPPSRRRSGTRCCSSRTPPGRRARAASTPTRRETLDGPAAREDTPEALAGTLDPEDLPDPALPRGAAAARARGRKLAHLVVDEAEDFSLFELFVLGRHLGGAQRDARGRRERSRRSSLRRAGRRRSRALGVERRRDGPARDHLPLPAPDGRAGAARSSGRSRPPTPPRAGRDGAPVARFDFPTEAHAHLFLAGAVRDLVEREPRGVGRGHRQRARGGARASTGCSRTCPRRGSCWTAASPSGPAWT